MFMTPKAYMITGLSKKGMWTECSSLELQDKELMLTLLCYSLPIFGEMCKTKKAGLVTLNRQLVQEANDRLYRLREVEKPPQIYDMIYPIEKKYKLPHHKESGMLYYSSYANSIRKFLYDGYMNCSSSTFDIVII